MRMPDALPPEAQVAALLISRHSPVVPVQEENIASWPKWTTRPAPYLAAATNELPAALAPTTMEAVPKMSWVDAVQAEVLTVPTPEASAA